MRLLSNARMNICSRIFAAVKRYDHVGLWQTEKTFTEDNVSLTEMLLNGWRSCNCKWHREKGV